MQQITNQIQKRQEEKRMQEELKECESQLMRKKQEKMNEEDLKVRPGQTRSVGTRHHAHTVLLTWLPSSRPWR